MCDFSIQIEKLKSDEIYGFLIKTKSDFPAFDNPKILNERVTKLANYANFVTARNNSGQIISMIAFYMNKIPICFITHVCTLSDYKRLGVFSKLYFVLEQEAKYNKFTTIKLEVRMNNCIAIACYKQMGFYISEQSNRGWYMEKNIM